MQSKVRPEQTASDDDEMTVFVWASGWGLPSIDPESLQIIAYVKFSGAPVKIKECENPWMSPTGVLPFFKHGAKVLYDPLEIGSYLRQKNYSCDFGLSPKQCADVIAYTQLVSENLAPALKYFCWVHESNYGSVIRPCYSKRLPWIYKFWFPEQRKRREAIEQIQSRHKVPESETAEPEILQKARDCINILSDRLGTQEFFLYPNSPSAVDAVIFPYLASFLKIPLPHSPVKEFIRSTPNLERFVARIIHRYHAKGRGPGADSAISSTNFGLDGHPTAAKPDESNFPVIQKVTAVTVGLGIMLAFAYYNGIVSFEFLGSSSSSMDEGEDGNNEDDENLIWE